ncbi:hypothetical protein H6F67_09255 [Microcoleus sp. FACHB-1515]|uniref:hypothetical protein n=1 Tax=Cyanophyceae TaxID=3028117 RepID=UPI0016895C66|nr:hypothetical protein [Microcoleus sp. FACHB-1515]MBD2090038.1 hypothetical protein [Microcoleus sp. FACHB-1515]
MRLDLEHTKDTLHQCPRCSKYALVQRDADKFYCLWCHFNRDVSDSGGAISAVTIIAFFIFLLLVVSSASESNSPAPVQPALQEQVVFP